MKLSANGLFQSAGQLIGAGGGLAAAGGAFQAGNDVIHIHTFHQGRNALEVTVSAADELHILHLAVLDVKQDALGASAGSLILVHGNPSFHFSFIIRQYGYKCKGELFPTRLGIL